jgi:hypothetical protein
MALYRDTKGLSPTGIDVNKESVVATAFGWLRHRDKGFVRRLALNLSLPR